MPNLVMRYNRLSEESKLSPWWVKNLNSSTQKSTPTKQYIDRSRHSKSVMSRPIETEFDMDKSKKDLIMELYFPASRRAKKKLPERVFRSSSSMAGGFKLLNSSNATKIHSSKFEIALV